MQLVDEYIASLTGPKKEWIEQFVGFFREIFPNLEETFDHKMPTYKGDGFYIAFAAQKNYFSFYTDDKRVLPLIKDLIPPAFMGKSCARIKYSHEYAIEELMDVCKEIVDYHNRKRSSVITDMTGLKKWSSIPSKTQQMLLSNVFCSTCGVTTMVNYSVQNDRLGLVLKGKCSTCGGNVARFIENE
ncbi:DUF1801 domain-containing protein [Bacillus sp. WMMC1349]|uniref:iron chaperone n=1 Tax=Bacillus sp. WMMC1349 TaxID=2736254 RepID=UPI00155245E7|nr:DUF1801 domain-containing protein [Bacillus sp. WMMC1349]NPC91870.1 DUF1801 domain-containing protein [Bacillus sp. WMMC1349]